MARSPQSLDPGAAERTVRALGPLLDGPPAPEVPPRPWALPLVGPTTVVLGLRAKWRALRPPVRVGVPVVSVGSTNPRGPGKTSTVRWLVTQLGERGHQVGVALRGYRRTRPGRDVRLSSVSASVADLGDEGALHAQSCLVAAAPDRVAAAQALVAAGCSVIVLDDGLQHRRLHRDVDLLVVDARFPEARGLMPAGERREREVIPRRVTGVIAHHGRLQGAATAIRQTFWVTEAPQGPVAAFAGLGRPADLFTSLDGPVARFRALSDHQPISDALGEELLRWARGLPLVTTAKDAVRLPAWMVDRVHVRDVVLDIVDADPAWFPELP